MLLSKNLITKFIPSFGSISNDDFKNAINAMGMELETIYNHPKNTNLVIGKILEVKKHPSSNHLNICKVKVDDKTILNIVCGANNVTVNKYVIVALNGAMLFNNKLIQNTKIKDVESQGMLCAYAELTNLTDSLTEKDKQCIILLDEATIGDKNVYKYVNLDDEIYDISLPANRNELNSAYVFCKEIAGKLKTKFTFKYEDSFNLNYFIKNNKNTLGKNKICNCLNFLHYDISTDDLKESNWELKSILMNNGINPINYLLDRLAYLSLLTNAPTHIYDASKIDGQLKCCLSKKCNYVGLDDKTYVLNKDIVIQDDKKITSLASIIGSNETKLLDSTKKIIIEIGNFNHNKIRTSALRLNVNTNASKQSSKAQSVYLNLLLHHLVKQELKNCTNEIIDFVPNWSEKCFNFNKTKFNSLVENKVDDKQIDDSLIRLSFVKSEGLWNVPKWRLDIANNADLVEEVLKIMDIVNIQSIDIVDSLLPLSKNYLYEMNEKVKNVLCSNYFNEVKTYNLASYEKLQKFNVFNLNDFIKINTSNSNRQYYRVSLLDGMLNVYRYNNARKNELVPIFEIQKVYTKNNNFNMLSILIDKKGIVLDYIDKTSINGSVSYLKEILNEICDCILAQNITYSTCKNKVDYLYENDQLSILVNNNVIGYIGKIKKTSLKDYDLQDKNIYSLIINLSELFNNVKTNLVGLKKVNPYQLLHKDVNLILQTNSNLDITTILDKIESLDNIIKANVVDFFEKDGKQIYTIRYWLDDSKLYNNNDLENISKLVNKIITF